ncbi:MAG: FAD:protein FMN transferase [Coriobacteriales bacterium]|jgi:thiamine biosynthesis lipoprotein
MPDEIPMQDMFEVSGPSTDGLCKCTFMAFNTVVWMSAYPDSERPDTEKVLVSFERARNACRAYERLFSRTLPNSDITILNSACGKWVDVDPRTHELLRDSLFYCAQSEGLFDITIGSASRLWDFHTGKIPDPTELEVAMEHVDWRKIALDPEGPPVKGEQCRARLSDPEASVDLGGIAKGYIADRLVELMLDCGIGSFVINLGGNVVARGRKPDGSKWTVGVQDPANREKLKGAIELEDASAVTSGIYERCFVRDGIMYHHILHPKTGMPVRTDLAGVTLVAQRSIDAEGFSTSVLAMGMHRGMEFAASRPEIEGAILIGVDGRVLEA